MGDRPRRTSQRPMRTQVAAQTERTKHRSTTTVPAQVMLLTYSSAGNSLLTSTAPFAGSGEGQMAKPHTPLPLRTKRWSWLIWARRFAAGFCPGTDIPFRHIAS